MFLVTGRLCGCKNALLIRVLLGDLSGYGLEDCVLLAFEAGVGESSIEYE
jgi:hypothetical protein